MGEQEDVAEVALFLQEQATIQSEDRPFIAMIRTQVSSLCVQDAGSLPIPQEPSVEPVQLCATSATGRAITSHNVFPKQWLPLTN